MLNIGILFYNLDNFNKEKYIILVYYVCNNKDRNNEKVI